MRVILLTVLLAPCLLTLFVRSAMSDDGEPADSSRFLTAPRLPVVSTPSEPEIQKSLDRGIQFLLDDQNKDGSWGTPERTKRLNIFAPVPGGHDAFRTATTSLCLKAMYEIGGDREEVQQAIDRCELWMFERLPKLRRAGPVAIYNVWGHAYAIQALVSMHGRYDGNADRQKKILDLLRSQYDYLERYESVDGGWGYYDFRAGTKKPATDSTSFLTAAVLIAFDEARDIGVPPPEKLVKRAVDSIRRQQKPDFSYLYGEYLRQRPMRGINRPGGSLGRSQACNLALRLWGDERITDQVMKSWLDRLFSRNGWLSMGRKRPIPHESWFQVAGYFFYYGHYYGALCIEELKADDRHDFQAHMATLMLKLQEKDGSWWDYPLYNYHQQYGTAYALMTLVRCRSE